MNMKKMDTINFLDTTVTRNINENKLDIRWFCNFHSSHHH